MRRPDFRATLAAALLAAVALVAFAAAPALAASSDDEDEIKEKIEEQQDQIKKLDQEIEAQRLKLMETAGVAHTLDSAVRTLDASVRKIDTSIKKTELGIKTSELTIKSLGSAIDQNRAEAARARAAVARVVAAMDASQGESGIERVLAVDDLGAVWEALDASAQVRDNLRTTAEILSEATVRLTDKQLAEEREKSRLAQAKEELGGEREAAATTKAEKAQLLAETQSKQAEYQRTLDEKLAQKQKFEAALREFEAQLDVDVDQDGYAAAAKGLISWPVQGLAKITQLFGGTEFAKQHAQAYGRAFHPGLDIGAPIGEPVLSVLPGTVTATGNTDAVPGCSSWGKWILVKHGNGISSLYAHLSGFAASAGDSVAAGETIGYIGKTGYATGPHLHLTLYATEGVSVRRFEEFKSATGCAGATTPVAPPEAYLDPMDYLPSTGYQMYL